MSILSTVVIEGNVIITPAAYQISIFVPGLVSAGFGDRTWVQAFRTDARREFVLDWGAIGDADCANLRTSFAALCDRTCPFTDMRGNTYDVVRHPAQPKITFKAIKLYDVYDARWAVTLKMLEAHFE